MVDSPHRILIVEDDDGERDALARVLRLEKYEVIAARSIAEAMELAVETLHPQPVSKSFMPSRMEVSLSMHSTRRPDRG